MKVTIVPSSIASAGEEPSQYLISYLFNDTLAIDAGSLGLYGTPHAQAQIQHVLISHTHIDHTATLPIFIENAYEGKADCVTVHGSDAVLESLRHDMFNDRTWPDFVALSQGAAPFLKLARLEAGQTVELAGLRITPVAVNHVVPTLGFLVEDESVAVLIASDTGPTEELWRLANGSSKLKAVFLEAAFPNELAELASISKHLTPSLFGAEVRKLTRDATVVAVHIKARFRTAVLEELRALELPNLEIGVQGKVYTW
ncbi:MAG: 3',5'-cyclic-nucleotide phosphodiesterase [Isosphaeraceae bacterium]|nr:3',5'-cyclic-nucleotide phosphodiesterase [Isosphaeraceae bacterium]